MNYYQPTHQNEAKILKNIINQQAVSRSQLSELTNLTKSSISDIVKTLLEKKIIYEGELGDSTNSGGRRPVSLKFNDKSALIIAIEVRKNYINSCLSYINGEVILEYSYQKNTINKDNVVEYIDTIIKKLQKNKPSSSYGIVGAGIAIHGTVHENQITFTPFADIDEVNLSKKLSKKFDFPILLINEANASALGEYSFTSNSENLININIEDGIGAGIIENGILYTGKSGNAGEIGHTTLYPNGILCPCGNYGCIEQYASKRALFNQIAQIKNKKHCTTKDIIKYWEASDQKIVHLLEKNALQISIAINNIATMYDPEIIILNNKLFTEIPKLIDIIKNNLTGRNTNDIDIQTSHLNNQSVLLGCIALVANNFLKTNKLKFKNSTS